MTVLTWTGQLTALRLLLKNNIDVNAEAKLHAFWRRFSMILVNMGGFSQPPSLAKDKEKQTALQMASSEAADDLEQCWRLLCIQKIKSGLLKAEHGKWSGLIFDIVAEELGPKGRPAPDNSNSNICREVHCKCINCCIAALYHVEDEGHSKGRSQETNCRIIVRHFIPAMADGRPDDGNKKTFVLIFVACRATQSSFRSSLRAQELFYGN